MRDDKYTYLEDYQPHAYRIDKCKLHFDIGDTQVLVTNTLHVFANQKVEDLELDQKKLDLVSVECNGTLIDDYTLDSDRLVIPKKHLAPEFELTIQNRIDPKKNTESMGLYYSEGVYLTQNEPEGFRRITPFIDRPDNQSFFEVSIEAPKAFPYLLSNGNKMEERELENDKCFARWEDPFRKPSYLFALVVGQFYRKSDSFTTKSGKEVAIDFFTLDEDLSKVDFALESLKKAMKWDEERFGLEYDLSNYSIVVTNQFNMGAMENKSLNVFQAKYVLASPETASDDEFLAVESVIGHEYFHNWTGNRVTLRDWFQLTLKEGLTVFRDQIFSEDLNVEGLERLKSIEALIEAQFSEDAGPLAHSIRPHRYLDFNNFYTSTVYNKGSEVIRMIYTMIGKEAFRKALIHYIEVNDQKSARVEDFIKAMESSSGKDLGLFKSWYSQIGTPVVTVDEEYDERKKSYQITLEQNNEHPLKNTPCLHIPLSLQLFDEKGNEMWPKAEVVECVEPRQTFQFENISEKPRLSINRSLSAPVIVKKTNENTQDKLFFLEHETDLYLRMQAFQSLVYEQIQKGLNQEACDEAFIETLRKVFNSNLDAASCARLIHLPGAQRIMRNVNRWEPSKIISAREQLKKQVGQALEGEMQEFVANYQDDYTDLSAEAMGRRAKTVSSLRYLIYSSEKHHEHAVKIYHDSSSMTIRFGVLLAMVAVNSPAYPELMNHFAETYNRFDTCKLNWLKLNATVNNEGVYAHLEAIRQSESFDELRSNEVSSLYGSFANANLRWFHHESGQGYEVLADRVIHYDSINQDLAARLARSFRLCSQMDENLRNQASEQLQKIQAKTSTNAVKEITDSILNSLTVKS